MPSETIQIGRRTLKVSNLDKILYPSTGFTKSGVIAYYLGIADAILPHLKGRPLTLKRYPDGVTKDFFYEKNCPVHRPAWLSTENRPSDRRSGGIDYCVIDSKPGLVWVANLAALELHVLLSKGRRADRPTHMVFDLDPSPGLDILDCARVAFTFREMLEHLGLRSLVKTSGSKGLHLCVPLNTPVTFDQTKTFARALADLLQKHEPDRVTSHMSKAKRAGKIFVDWSQNDDHKTTVCVYSLRAKERPSVSTPITWEELESAVKKRSVKRLFFDPADVLRRFDKHGDLFQPLLKLKQRLPSLDAVDDAP